MVKCEKCKKNLFFKKKYFNYHGDKIGSFRIAEEKILCKKCYGETNSLKRKSFKKIYDLTKKNFEKKFDESLKITEANFDEKSSFDWYNKGNLLDIKNKKNSKDVLACYDKAIYLDTHYVKAWYRKGQKLYDEDKFFDAIRCFDNVIELESDRPVDEVFNGSCWLIAGLMMKALALIASKKFNEADKIFITIYSYIYKYAPFNEIEPEKFIEYCIENAAKILKMFEPSGGVSLWKIGVRH